MRRLFETFFFAGFEGATGINAAKDPLDQVRATHHDACIDDDYARIRTHRLMAARESVRWPLCDRGGRYDFSSLDPIAAAARRYGIAVLFDLFHFGYPDDTSPFDAGFVDRFASYCAAAARAIGDRFPPPHVIAPVNEPSYYAWAAGEVGRFAPHLHGAGPALKRRMIEAAIAGVEAVWSALPDARVISVDPLCHVVPPPNRPDLAEAASHFNQHAVFESWDMLCGRLEPQLGGSPRHLGIVGVNYYTNNQWEMGDVAAPLDDDDPRRLPLRTLLARAAKRYGAPIVITETAGIGDGRPAWLHRLADECARALAAGVPLEGACLYPVLSMPEWHQPATWAPLGLWDLELSSIRTLERVPHRPALRALAEAQRRLGDTSSSVQRKLARTAEERSR